MSDKDTVVRVENLQTYFNTYDGLVKAVDGVSFEVKEGGYCSGLITFAEANHT
jgi:ABC-type dipeptide/oligopeptide/nickel transport system ATPase component